jgi:hypothetical protein
MSESPYAPPQAVVADVESGEPPLERPWQVSRAMTCLWVSLGLGAANSLWNLVQPPPQLAAFNRGWLLLMYVVGFVIVGMVYRAIGRGRNWARILLLILTGLGVLGLPFLYFSVKVGTTTPLVAIVGLVNSCLGFYAAYLLLTGAAKAWYRNMKERF